MRLTALAILALSSSSGVEGIRRRLPSAPPYPISPAAGNTSAHGLTDTSHTPSSSSQQQTPAGRPSSSPTTHKQMDDSSLSSSGYNPTGYLAPSSSKYTPSGYAASSGSKYQPSGYTKSSRPIHRPSGHLSSSTSNYNPTGHAASSGSLPKPTGNSTSQIRSKCSGQTLNVLEASLDWWYSRTLYNVVSTISVQFNRNDTRTGWTVLPATTPFDLASAMASPTCTSTLTWNSYWNISLYDVSCTPAPTPVAASTLVITQTAFKQLNASTGTGGIPDVVRTPPPATITIPSAGGSYAEGTAFVYFSAYEIVSKTASTFGNGSVGCVEATQTYPMATPFSFEYAGGEVNGSQAVGAGVTGDVNPAFLQVVSKSAVAGSWVAAATVAVVVQDIFAAEAALAAQAGPILTTETILQTPQPTLPPGFSTAVPETVIPTPGSPAHIESTARSLDVPTQVQITKPSNGHPTNTKGGGPPQQTTGPGGKPTPVGGTSITGPNGKPTPIGGKSTTGPNGKPTPIGGKTTTGPNGKPTPIGGKTTPGSGPQPKNTPSAIHNIVSAILGAVTPTNALQVLQQAQQSFTTHTNPTAAAILKGITPGSNTGLGTGPDGKPTLVIDGTTITANSRTQFNVGKATLTPGGTAVDHGKTVSLDLSLAAVVVNGQTHTASNAGITPAPVLTIGGTTFAPTNGPTYVVGGSTLTPGGVITVHGTTVSLARGGSSVVVNGATQTLGSASITAPPPDLTVGGQTFTPINSGPTYVIDGETLTPGGSDTVVLAGKTYILSLAPGATVLMIETVGRNGQVTATTYETLFAGSSQTTVTNTVGAAASGSRPSAAGPSQSVQASVQNAAAAFSPDGVAFGGLLGVALASLAIAVWF